MVSFLFSDNDFHPICLATYFSSIKTCTSSDQHPLRQPPSPVWQRATDVPGGGAGVRSAGLPGDADVLGDIRQSVQSVLERTSKNLWVTDDCSRFMALLRESQLTLEPCDLWAHILAPFGDLTATQTLKLSSLFSGDLANSILRHNR